MFYIVLSVLTLCCGCILCSYLECVVYDNRIFGHTHKSNPALVCNMLYTSIDTIYDHENMQ